MHHKGVICHLCTNITWSSIEKNEFQVDFSHKVSKNEFFKLRDRQIVPIYMV